MDEVPIVRGRRRLIYYAAEQGLTKFLEDNLIALKEECYNFLKDEYNIDADVITIRRALVKLNLTNKRATKINAH